MRSTSRNRLAENEIVSIGLDTGGVEEYNLLGDIRGLGTGIGQRTRRTVLDPHLPVAPRQLSPEIFCFSARWTAEAGRNVLRFGQEVVDLGQSPTGPEPSGEGLTAVVRKIDRDANRFKQIVRGKIKSDLRKYITHGEMIGKTGGEFVSIPLPQIEIPEFRYGTKNRGGVGQGPGDVGTPIGRSSDGDAGTGAGDARATTSSKSS